MIKFNRTLVYIPAVLFTLVACHHSSLDSRATIVPRPQPQHLVTPITPASPVVAEIPAAEPKKPQPKKLSDEEVNDRMVARLDSLMNDPFLLRTQLGLYVYDLTKDQPLYESGKTQSMRPASTMKVITAVTALSQLGVNYQYTTGLYLSGKVQKGTFTGNFFIKGGFDPLTGNETVNQFASAIIQKGITRIHGDLVLDLSMKDDKEAGWGWCWDDKNPSLCPLLYKEKPNFGEALQQALLRRGVRITGIIRTGRVPSQAQMLSVHTTHIDKALKPMMKMSVNQVAESLFYQIAAQNGKPYVTHHTASAYVKRFIQEQLHLVPEHYRIADGSGLSQYNYITPELLVEALRYAYQHQDIYRHLLPALPVAGEDGTLKNRMRYTSAHGKVAAKTGTLTSVCSLAGYTTAKNGHRLCFAIINQGQMKGTEARNFQDEVCYILTR